MIDLLVTFDTGPLERALRSAPAAVLAGLKEGGTRGLLGFRKAFLAKTPAHLSRGRRGLASPSNWPVESSGNTIATLSWAIYTTSRAAHLLEKGGTVRPANAKMIALPLAGVKNRSGSARLPGYSTPKIARQKRGSVFVTYRTRKGTLLLLEVRRGGKRQRGTVAAFVLVPSIHADPILGFFATWQDDPSGSTDFVRRLGLTLNRELRNAGLPPTGVTGEAV